MSGCGSTRVVTEYETIEVPVERLIPIDPELTRPIDPPELRPVVWKDAAVLVVEYRARYQACEAQKAAIRQQTDEG